MSVKSSRVESSRLLYMKSTSSKFRPEWSQTFVTLRSITSKLNDSIDIPKQHGNFILDKWIICCVIFQSSSCVKKDFYSHYVLVCMGSTLKSPEPAGRHVLQIL